MEVHRNVGGRASGPGPQSLKTYDPTPPPVSTPYTIPHLYPPTPPPSPPLHFPGEVNPDTVSDPSGRCVP